MNEEQIKLLIDIGISKDDIPNCFIAKDGKIFTPLKDEDDNLLKTGEQIYNEWLENKDKEVEKEPTEGEILISNILLENAEIKGQLKEQQELSVTLALQIAELKGGVI